MEKENMNDNIAKIFRIDGIYGRIEGVTQQPKQDEEKISHDYYERDIRTGEDISSSYDIKGLPNGITKSEYFNMALLKVLGEIRDELRKDSYVNIKNLSGDFVKGVEDDIRKSMLNINRRSGL